MVRSIHRGSLAIPTRTLSPRERVDNILVDLTPEFLKEGKARGIEDPSALKVYVDGRLTTAREEATGLIVHERGSHRTESF